jgi:hypothetical protein
MRLAGGGLLIAIAACAASTPAVAPPTPPRHRVDVYGMVAFPHSLTVSLVAADGTAAASGTVPPGTYHFSVWPGTYELGFTDPEGTDLAGCATRLNVSSEGQTIVSASPPPRGCPVPLWRVIDRAHPLTYDALGAPTDFKTSFGEHEGYRVLPCDSGERNAMFFVIHEGSTKAPDLGDRAHAAAFDVWVDRERALIAAAMEPMSAGAGFGRPCRKDQPSGIIVYVSDWHQADEALARLVKIVREQDLAIGLSVELIALGTEL